MCTDHLRTVKVQDAGVIVLSAERHATRMNRVNRKAKEMPKSSSLRTPAASNIGYDVELWPPFDKALVSD